MTHHRLSLRRNFSWSMGGNVVFAGCQFVTLMAMTKLLDVEQVGMFVLATAVVTPIQMMTNMQLRGVLCTDTSNLHDFGSYIFLRLMTSLATLVLGVAISAFLDKGLEMVAVMFGVALFKSVDSTCDIFYGWYEKHENLKGLCLSRVARGLGSLLIFVPILYFTRNLPICLIAMAVSWAAVLCILDLPASSQFGSVKLVFRFANIVELVKIAIPLGVAMLLISLNSSIPRYFSEIYLGTAELGYFGALAYMVAVMSTVMAALTSATTQRLARDYIGNVGAFKRLLLKMLGVAIGLGGLGIVVGVLAGKTILTIAYSADYAEYQTVFVLLLVSAALGYVNWVVGSAITATRLFKTQVPLTLAATISLLLVCPPMIQSFGTAGAAISVCVGQAIQVLATSAIVILAVYQRERRLGLS